MEVYATLTRARRLRGRPPGRRASRSWASSTTRCSSTSSATTAARSIGDLNGSFVEWSKPQRRAGRRALSADPPRRVRRTELLPELRGGLGDGRRHSGHVGITMAHGGGNNGRDGRALAQGNQGQGRDPPAVHAASSTSCRRSSRPSGVPEPKMVNGVEQTPMAGISMKYSFDNGDAKERHTTQYNEAAGNRSIYHDGWMAAVVHNVTWEPAVRDRFRSRQVGALQYARGLRAGERPGGQVPEEGRGDEDSCSTGRPSSTACIRWTTAASSA